jgi:YHS domain-containing protein
MAKSRCTMCGDKIGDIVKEVYKGEEYHFCSQVCRLEFLNEPDRYRLVWPSLRRRGIVMERLICAVCGNEVPEDEAHRQAYQEQESYEKYYFCCGGCRMEFINDPDKYTGQSGKHLA